MRYLVTIAALAVTLAGCTLGPDYVRPEIQAPEGWRIEEQPARDVANTEWWRQFGDPVLDELIATALRENKDLRIATRRVEQFAALVDSTRSGFYPQVGYDVFGAREQASRAGPVALPEGVDRVAETYRATLNVGWELDVWGRLSRATEAARADLLASEEGRRTVILSLVSAVATGYITLLSLDRQLEITRRTLATRADSLKLFETQFRGGVVGELTVAQAFDKPVIAIKSFGDTLVVPAHVIDVAAETVEWNDREITDAIRRHGRGEDVDQWDVVDFDPD